MATRGHWQLDTTTRRYLESKFEEDPKPTTEDLNRIATHLGQDIERIRHWFKNRRSKKIQDDNKEDLSILLSDLTSDDLDIGLDILSSGPPNEYSSPADDHLDASRLEAIYLLEGVPDVHLLFELSCSMDVPMADLEHWFQERHCGYSSEDYSSPDCSLISTESFLYSSDGSDYQDCSNSSSYVSWDNTPLIVPDSVIVNNSCS